MSDKKDDTGSQADELTEMWDADSLRDAGLDMDSPAAATSGDSAAGPATKGVGASEASIQVAIGPTAGASAAPKRKKKKRKKKTGLDALGLPAQIAIAVLVAVGTFLVVRLLIS